ncbi:hypothetical protein [Streptomyces sp. NBC_00057]|uniref:hypothetical protein n=1 Tax=Streptomyces sp. NBC_00057 TaxID=2975634 RepID=UPI00324BADEF
MRLAATMRLSERVVGGADAEAQFLRRLRVSPDGLNLSLVNSTGSGGDPLLFFKMYGADSGSGETWHSTQVATNGFIGAILSIIREG